MSEINTLEQAYNQTKYSKLVAAIAIDLIGMATYLIPALGEFGDIALAPVSAIANMILFGGMTGVLGGTFTFAEEILPGTDFIPSVTLTWITKYVVRDEQSFADFVQKRRKREQIAGLAK